MKAIIALILSILMSCTESQNIDGMIRTWSSHIMQRPVCDHNERAWLIYCHEDGQTPRPATWTQWEHDNPDYWGVDEAYWERNRKHYCCPAYTALMYREGREG